MDITEQQRFFLKFIWPLRMQHPPINNLSLIVEPMAKNRYIALLWPRGDEHALILPIKQEITDFLKNLRREHYRINITSDWTEAVKYLFVYFRGLVPEYVSEKLSEMERDDRQTNHWRFKLGVYLTDIRTTRQELLQKMSKNPSQKRFNVDQFIQYELKRFTHPGAILLAMRQIYKNWGVYPILNPWGYAQKVVTIESQNFNEEDSIKLHQQTKFFNIPNFLRESIEKITKSKE